MEPFLHGKNGMEFMNKYENANHEAVKYCKNMEIFNGICHEGGGESFCQKNLCGKGGYPPPPLTERPLSFSGNFFPKRAKNDVFFIK